MTPVMDTGITKEERMTREERMRARMAERLGVERVEQIMAHMSERFDVERDAEPLRAAALTVAETFPDDWRNATFRIELERTTETGPSVAITFYEIIGDHSDSAGGTCG
jgi:hypothetical protein